MKKLNHRRTLKTYEFWPSLHLLYEFSMISAILFVKKVKMESAETSETLLYVLYGNNQIVTPLIFITEAIWENKQRKQKHLIVESW